MKNAVVLQHVAFEDLGTLQPLLSAQGWQLQVLQAGVDALDPAEAADLLVVLGGRSASTMLIFTRSSTTASRC